MSLGVRTPCQSKRSSMTIAFRDECCVVTGVWNAVACAGLGIVGEQQVVGIAELPGHRPGVRIEEQLCVVEPPSPFGAIFAPDFVAIELTRPQSLDASMPDELVTLFELNDVGFLSVRCVNSRRNTSLAYFE